MLGERVKQKEKHTIEEQMSKSDIDGALIGGASLKSESLNEIIEKTMKMSLVH